MSRTRTESALKNELSRLASVSLWQEDDGSYHLFGRYEIQEHENEFTVTKDRQEQFRFGSRRAAAVWCVADRCGDHTLAQTVRSADRHLIKLTADLSVRRSIHGSAEFTAMVQAKTEPKQRRIQELKLEIDRCVRLAKHYQRGLSK